MYADRHAPARVDRASLGLSVGIVGALLAAGMLASPVVEHLVVDDPLEVYRVPIAPPPPTPPKPETKVTQRPPGPSRSTVPSPECTAKPPTNPRCPMPGRPNSR